MQNKMLYHILAVEIFKWALRCSFHHLGQHDVLFGEYLWCFLAEAAARCFYSRPKFSSSK